jgi:F-type H+-transporting ATPase subunit epsilon
MRLSITTALEIIVDAQDCTAVRAQDDTGAFGILPGHADFLTALAVHVLTWHDPGAVPHHVVVRGGMLRVHGGDTVAIATPEAVAGDDLLQLETQVLTRFRQQLDEERGARTEAQRLQLAAIRQIVRLLRET